jgi:hypothetical protein
MEIINWLDANKQWIFSGIGVAIIAFIIRLICNRRQTKKQIQQSGDNSINIQVGDNLNIHTQETDDEGNKEE